MITCGSSTAVQATAAIYPEDPIDIRVGQILEAVCQVTGMPQPYVKWTMQVGHTVEHLPHFRVASNSLFGLYFQNENATAPFENERKLNVLIEDRTFSGPLQCTATNGVGEPASAAVEVIVNCRYTAAAGMPKSTTFQLIHLPPFVRSCAGD